MTSAPSIVNVIVGADYGERLRDLPGEEGFFIAASCADITEPSAVAPGQFPRNERRNEIDPALPRSVLLSSLGVPLIGAFFSAHQPCSSQYQQNA